MTRQQRIGLVAGAIVAAFLIGFGWQFVRAQGLASELEATRDALIVQELEATLGAATIQAQRGNFEIARRLASDFFVGLQTGIAAAPPPARPELSAILADRDAIITELARANPESAEMLADHFVRFRSARAGPEAVAPGVGTVPD